MKKKNVNFYVAAAVSLMTFAVYLFSLSNEFVRWDDKDYILANPHIRSMDPAFFRWAFLDFYSGNWHPLTWLSHAVDYAVWGLDPLGHHLTNNLLHAVNTFIVVLLSARLIGIACAGPGALRQAHESRFTLIAAATTGLLFGLHPIHVESVAWVAERKDLLCGLFYLLSVMAYISYKASATYKTYIFSLGFFVLALLSKPMAVSLPVVLLILDWYPFEKIRSLSTLRDAFIQKIPFIVLSAVSSVLTILAQREGGAMHAMEFIPLPSRLLVAAKALVVYLGKMILPLNLVPFYPYPENVSLLSLKYFSAVALVICITVICTVFAKKHKVWPAIWAYYVITLLPVLGIVQVGAQSMADRYTYLPGCGPFLAAGLLVAWFSIKADALKRWNPQIKVVRALAAFLVIAIMTFATVKQIGVWKNAFSLMDYIIQKENYDMAYHNRGQLYEEMGWIDKALADYTRAIALNSYNYIYYYARGLLLMKAGRINEALQDYDRTIALNPSAYEAYINRGNIFLNLKKTDSALQDYSQAIAVDPSRFEAYQNRGVLHLNAGENSLAASDFRQLCDLGNENGCKAFQHVLSLQKAQGK